MSARSDVAPIRIQTNTTGAWRNAHPNAIAAIPLMVHLLEIIQAGELERICEEVDALVDRAKAERWV